MSADQSVRDAFQSRRSPLYEARRAAWYERQNLIQEYEKEQECRLVVLIDSLFAHSVTRFEAGNMTQNNVIDEIESLVFEFERKIP